MTPAVSVTVRRAVAAVAALIGLVLLVLGIVRAGATGAAEETSGATSRLDGVPVVTTSSGVLTGDGLTQVLLAATATGVDRTVFVGVARARDVEAWLADLGRVEVRGPGEGTGDEAPGEGSLELASREGATDVPDPLHADIWVAAETGQGAARLSWAPAAGDWRAVIAAGEPGGLQRVAVTWTRPAGPSRAPALVAIGLLLLVAGLVALLVLRRSGGPPRDEWYDDRPDGDDDGDSAVEDGPGGGEGATAEPDGGEGATADPDATSVIPRVRGRRRAGTPPWTSRVAVPLLALVVPVAGCSAGSTGASGAASPTGSGAVSGTASATGSGTAPIGEDLPVVLVSQADAVLDRVDAAAAAVAGSGRLSDIGDRAVGPYRAQLAAELKVRAATRGASPSPSPSASGTASASASASGTASASASASGTASASASASAPPVATGLTRDRLLITAQSGWPRFFLVAGTVAGRPTPVVRVLVSPDAREPYGIWAEPVLLPGATLPELAPATRGAPALGPDAAGLVASPQQVAEGYADVLTKGSASDAVDLFAADEFRRQVNARLSQDRKGVDAIGAVTSSHRLRDDGMLALRSADGGAVVIAALEQKYLVRIRSGAGTVTVDAPLAALAGRRTFSSSITRSSVEVVVFAVPPVGGGQVRVVAASKSDVEVAGS